MTRVRSQGSLLREVAWEAPEPRSRPERLQVLLPPVRERQ